MSARQFTISCELQSDPETVRKWILRPALFLHVAAPLVRFEAVGSAGFPEQWANGEYRGKMKLFGILPIGWQVIAIELAPSDENGIVLRDRGYGPMLPVWDHRISISPGTDGGTRYADALKLDAGLLSPIAVFVVKQFFRHRQRRLKALDATGFQALTR